MSNLSQTINVNIRVSPEIYSLFKQRAKKIGLKPSTFIKHYMISIAMEEDVQKVNEKRIDKFFDSLPKRQVDEEKLNEEINREKILAHKGK